MVLKIVSSSVFVAYQDYRPPISCGNIGKRCLVTRPVRCYITVNETCDDVEEILDVRIFGSSSIGIFGGKVGLKGS